MMIPGALQDKDVSAGLHTLKTTDAPIFFFLLLELNAFIFDSWFSAIPQIPMTLFGLTSFIFKDGIKYYLLTYSMSLVWMKSNTDHG